MTLHSDHHRKIAIISDAVVELVSHLDVFHLFSWSNLSELPYLPDYDVLIVDLTTCSDTNYIRWDQFFDALDFKTFAGIVAHSGQVIVLGNADFRCPNTGTYAGLDYGRSLPFLWWTGLDFAFVSGIGSNTRVVCNQHHLKVLFDHIDNYSSSVERISPSQRLQAVCFGNQSTVSELIVCFTPWVVNRNQNWLAGQALLTIKPRLANILFSPEAIESLKVDDSGIICGKLTLLPELNLSPSESIELVLSTIVGVSFSKIAPAWTDSMAPIGQLALDSTLFRLLTKQSEVEREIRETAIKRDSVRECLQLLYEDGVKLEQIVLRALSELGASVEYPLETNKEDGWISVTTDGTSHDGVLEIKSTEKTSFGEKGIRQLLEWKARGTMAPREKKYKGIMVGSNLISLPPDMRSSGYSESLKKSAQLNDLVLLSCEDLYTVLMLHRANAVDVGNFWLSLFSTVGVFDGARYRQELSNLSELES